MSFEVRVLVHVNAPDSATHYCGDLLDEPTWYRQKLVVGVPYWQHWSDEQSSWMIGSEHMPYFLKELQDTNIGELP